MISAGTVAAYLTLDTDNFNIGIRDAMNMLSALYSSSSTGAFGISLIQSAVNIAAGALNGGFAGALGAAAGNAQRAGLNISAAMLGTASSMISNISRAAQSTNSAGQFISAALSGTADAVRSNFGRITGDCTSSGSRITSVFSSLARSASGNMGSVVSSFHTLSAAQPVARAAAAGISSAIIGQLTPLRSRASSIMVSVGDGMVSGLSARSGAIIARARSIANSVASTIRAALRISSPSRVMREIGEQTGEGMALGISDMQQEVVRRSYELASGAVTAASSVSPTVQIPRIKADRAQAGYDTLPASGVQSGDIDRLDDIARRLDALIGYIGRTEQVMQVDGRTFGRLVREYI